MSDGGSFWEVAYHPARPALLLRGLYLALAGDLWLGMVQHGARYGMGGFNVAHFAWLDRLLPLPPAALYVGLLVASGAISVLLALGPAPRWLRCLLAATYTFAWMISVHDAYQHHYLLSWLLVWCVAYPDVRAADATGEDAASVRGWGLPMTAVTCAIVYAFTGISKSESEWRSGDVLKTLTHSAPMGDPHPGKFDDLRDLLVQLGVSESAVWPLLALSTVALQWTIAAGYLAAPARDARPSRLRTLLVSLGLFGALSFHAVAELFEVFEIGIFSYYMIWIALVLLSPVSLLVPLTSGLARIGRLRAGLRVPSGDVRIGLTFGVASTLLLMASGFLISLPGAPAATLSVGLVALGWILLASRRGDAAHSQGLALNVAITALALWGALAETSVVFDYYRRGAGELARMGRLEEALTMYRLAEQHAPPGESRRGRIEALEAQLRRGDEARDDVREPTPAPAQAPD